jgi:ribosomal protein L24E
MRLMECAFCGEPIEGGRGARYCGRPCYYAALRVRSIRACERCGFQFVAPPSGKRKFCSRKCYRLGMLRTEEQPRCEACGFNLVPLILQKVERPGRSPAALCPNCLAIRNLRRGLRSPE